MAEEKQATQNETKDIINKIKKEYPAGQKRDKIIKEYNELQKEHHTPELNKHHPFVIGGEDIETQDSKRYGKPKVWYTTDVKQVAEIATKNVLEHVSEDIKEATRNVSTRFKGYLTVLALLSLAAIGIGTFLSVKYIDKYSKQNTEQGKQFTKEVTKQGEHFTKEVTEVREKYNELNNNSISLDKNLKDNSDKIKTLEAKISDITEENKKQLLSLETSINELKGSFGQIQDAMKSDYGHFLQINNEMSKKIDDLTANLSAYEKELPKIQEAGIKVSSLDEKISQFITEQGKLNTGISELKRGFEKLEKESINKEEHNQLKKQIEGYEKTNKKLQENIDSLRKRVDSYDKEKNK